MCRTDRTVRTQLRVASHAEDQLGQASLLGLATPCEMNGLIRESRD